MGFSNFIFTDYSVKSDLRSEFQLLKTYLDRNIHFRGISLIKTQIIFRSGGSLELTMSGQVRSVQSGTSRLISNKSINSRDA